VIAGLAVALALVVVALRRGWSVKMVLKPESLTVETEPSKPEEASSSTPPGPVQEVTARGGGEVKGVEQTTRADTPSTQRVEAEGEDSRVTDVRQTIR